MRSAEASLSSQVRLHTLLRPFPLVLLLVASASVYRLMLAGNAEFWFDEYGSLWFSDPAIGLGELLAERWLPETSPPLYWFLLWAWRHVAPAEEFWMRLPSVAIVTSAALMPLFYGARGLDAPRRMLMAALLAGSFGFGWAALEARGYALVLLASTSGTLAYLSARAGLSGRKGAASLDLGVLVVSALVLGMTHFFGLLFGCALFGALTIEALARRRGVVPVLTAGLCAGLPLALWLGVHIPALEERTFWRTAIDLDLAASELREFARLAFGQLSSKLAVGLPVAVLVAFVVLRRRVSAAMLGLAAVACLMLLLASVVLAVKPVLMARYFVMLLPLIYAFMAEASFAAIEAWKPQQGLRDLATPVAAVAGFAGMTLSWPLLAEDHHQDWKQPAALINMTEECRNAPLVVVAEWVTWGYGDLLRPDLGIRLIPLRIGQVPEPGVWEAVMASSCPVKLWWSHVFEKDKAMLMRSMGLDRPPYRIIEFRGAFLVTASSEPATGTRAGTVRAASKLAQASSGGSAS